VSGPTNFYLQWKGTSACIDFRCRCGLDGHIDGDFVYFVRCPACNTLYTMPDTFYPQESTAEEAARAEGTPGLTRVFEVDPEDFYRVQHAVEKRTQRQQ
jgi:hypothetical protein